jgi:hypothetical protein
VRITKGYLEGRLKRLVELTKDKEYYLSWQNHGVCLFHKSRDVFYCGHTTMRNLDMRIEGFFEGYYARGEK